MSEASLKKIMQAFVKSAAIVLLLAIALPAHASILDEDPLAWRLSLNIGQDRLRFSSLWFEYSKFDEGLTLDSGPRAFNDDQWFMSSGNSGYYFAPQEMDMWHLGVRQDWGKSGFSTFERYTRYYKDEDTYNEWGVGLGFQYNPKLYFEVTYNDQPLPLQNDERDRQIRFRTMISF